MIIKNNEVSMLLPTGGRRDLFAALDSSQDLCYACPGYSGVWVRVSWPLDQTRGFAGQARAALQLAAMVAPQRKSCLKRHGEDLELLEQVLQYKEELEREIGR